MWRPWRKSSGNGTDIHHENYSVPCEQCEASSISLSPSTMNTYTTLTPRNAITSSSSLTSNPLIDLNGHHNHHHHFINRHPFIQEQPEVLIIKSDCESLSDDEVKSNTGSGKHIVIIFSLLFFDIFSITIVAPSFHSWHHVFCQLLIFCFPLLFNDFYYYHLSVFHFTLFMKILALPLFLSLSLSLFSSHSKLTFDYYLFSFKKILFV